MIGFQKLLSTSICWWFSGANQIWSESSLTSSGRNWRGSDKHGLGKWPFWWEKDLWRGDRQCSSKVRFPSMCVFTCIYCQYPANCHNLYAMVHYQFPITNHLKFSWLLVKPWFWIVELPSLLVKSACFWLKPHVCWLFRHLLLVETKVLLVKPRCFGGWTPHVCWLKPQVCCLKHLVLNYWSSIFPLPTAQAAPPIPLRRALTDVARDWTRSCRATMQHPGPPSSSRHSGSVYHTFYCAAIKREASMRVATHVDLPRKSKHGTRIRYIPV